MFECLSDQCIVRRSFSKSPLSNNLLAANSLIHYSPSFVPATSSEIPSDPSRTVDFASGKERPALQMSRHFVSACCVCREFVSATALCVVCLLARYILYRLRTARPSTYFL